jgi:3-oxoacyl-[acyl-carrier protein] reductase
MKMFQLDGKTALVTGASQGIGKAIAQRLAAQGARVVLAARSLEKLEALAGEITAAGGEAHPLRLDIANAAEATTTLSELPKEWAAIDILVSNAGITRDSLMARMSLEQWNEVLTTNLTGAYAVVRPLVRGMMKKRWGRIVFVSSVVGLMGNAGQANYAASKAGLVGMAKSLARELGGRNITANVVAPGFIETAMTEALDERAREGLAKSIVLGRFGRGEEIAAAVLYLASTEAGYVTGEVLNVSGGLYI